MSSDMENVRVVLKSLLRTHNGQVNLVQLGNWYEQQEGRGIPRFGFNSVGDLLRSWHDFQVTGSGLGTAVRTTATDHISEMNQRSK